MPSMRMKIALCSAASLMMAAYLPAQVTHGQKPKLPAPFESKSVGNGPDREKPSEGFLPTVPAGFKVNVYMSGIRRPRWLTVAPNGDIFLADTTGSGQIIVLHSGNDTSVAPEREAFVDGMNARQYATGLRNPVGLAIEPVTGKVWTSVNERDELGDDLPPDYFTSLQDGGFYGWPYSYIGSNVDPRVEQQHPELVKRAIVPDVLLGAHVAPLRSEERRVGKECRSR